MKKKHRIVLPDQDPTTWRAELLELDDALAGKPTKYWTRVEYPEPVEKEEVGALRHKLKLTQLGLAQALGMSLPTVRSWEQGTKKPTGLARKVLRAAMKEPKLLRQIAKA